jgi:hypothetical protein
METEGSLPCSQKPPTGRYPEPDESSPQLLILYPQDPFFLSGFPTKTVCAFVISSMRVTCPAYRIRFDKLHHLWGG